MSKEVRVIKVVVDTSQAKGIQKLSSQFASTNKQVKNLDKNVKGMSSSIGRIKGMFVGLAAAMGGREIVRSIDSFQLLKDRIRALGDEGTDAEDVFRKLSAAATHTRSSVEVLAEGYNRVAIATSDLGMSSEDTIKIVTALQQTLRLSGSSAMEASSVFLQFSQALSLGRFQGQELKAILLNDVILSKLLAKELDATKGELKFLGEKGQITAGVGLRSLLKNFEKLNKQAAGLGVTIGQTLILSMDAFRRKLDELNGNFAITTKIATFFNFIIDRMDDIFRIGTAILAAGIFSKIVKGILSISAAIKTGGLAAMFSPTGFLIAGVGVLTFLALKLTAAGTKAEEAAKKLRSLNKEIEQLQENNALAKANGRKSGDSWFSRWFGGKVEMEDASSRLKDLIAERDKAQNQLNALNKYGPQQENKNKKKKGGLKVEGSAGAFKKINALYRDRNLSMSEYLNLLREHKLIINETSFKQDKKSAYDYTEAIKSINLEMDKLIKKQKEMSTSEHIFDGIKAGAQQVMDSVGTLSDQIAKVTTQAFDRLEDSLFDFIKTGQFEFKKFAQAMLDDLTRVIIRMSIIKPLAGAAVGAMGGTASPATASANGNAFNGGNVIPFARGGVVGSDTYFPMSNGRTGLMGEAGPEAIMPLSRGKNGKLGVAGAPTIINVINNSSNTETQTKESTGVNGEKQIEIIVLDKVGKAIGEGRFDRTFQESYGMTRRGR